MKLNVSKMIFALRNAFGFGGFLIVVATMLFSCSGRDTNDAVPKPARILGDYVYVGKSDADSSMLILVGRRDSLFLYGSVVSGDGDTSYYESVSVWAGSFDSSLGVRFQEFRVGNKPTTIDNYWAFECTSETKNFGEMAESLGYSSIHHFEKIGNVLHCEGVKHIYGSRSDYLVFEKPT